MGLCGAIELTTNQKRLGSCRSGGDLIPTCSHSSLGKFVHHTSEPQDLWNVVTSTPDPAADERDAPATAGAKPAMPHLQRRLITVATPSYGAAIISRGDMMAACAMAPDGKRAAVQCWEGNDAAPAAVGAATTGVATNLGSPSAASRRKGKEVAAVLVAFLQPVLCRLEGST